MAQDLIPVFSGKNHGPPKFEKENNLVTYRPLSKDIATCEIVAKRERMPLRHSRILSLKIDESVLYRWDEISGLENGYGAVRSAVDYWAKKSGNIYETNKSNEGVWVKLIAE